MAVITTPVQVNLHVELDHYAYMVDTFANVKLYCLQHEVPLELSSAQAMMMTPLTSILELIATHERDVHTS